MFVRLFVLVTVSLYKTSPDKRDRETKKGNEIGRSCDIGLPSVGPLTGIKDKRN